MPESYVRCRYCGAVMGFGKPSNEYSCQECEMKGLSSVTKKTKKMKKVS